MKSQINLLRQLQELVLTRDEHNQTGDGSHLDGLNQAIASLQGKLDPLAAGLFQRLYNRSHIVISAMSKGCCAVCGMHVPIAQAQQVQLANHLVTCSSCGRILFASGADEPCNIAADGDHDEPKVGISRFSAEELMVPSLKATTKAEAIEELADVMAKGHFISNVDSFVTAVLERENVLSTAMGDSLAFPHVRGVEGGALTLAVGTSEKGIDWGGTKVNAIFLSAIPVAVSAFYLRLMSGITQSFSKAATLDQLVAAKTQAEMWKALCKATRTTVK